MNLFLRAWGSCFLPTSVAGFIQANTRKFGFFNIISSSTSPNEELTVKYFDSTFIISDKHSRTSTSAMLTSSSKIQFPFLAASAKTPLTNENSSLLPIVSSPDRRIDRFLNKRSNLFSTIFHSIFISLSLSHLLFAFLVA